MSQQKKRGDGSAYQSLSFHDQQQLSDEQYRVTREAGTERAFTGEYYNNKDDGVYRCVCCGEPLFSSDEKYDCKISKWSLHCITLYALLSNLRSLNINSNLLVPNHYSPSTSPIEQRIPF